MRNDDMIDIFSKLSNEIMTSASSCLLTKFIGCITHWNKFSQKWNWFLKKVQTNYRSNHKTSNNDYRPKKKNQFKVMKKKNQLKFRSAN